MGSRRQRRSDGRPGGDRRKRGWPLRLVRGFLLLFIGTSLFFVVLYRFVPVPVTPLMVIRCAEQLLEGSQLRLSHRWVAMKDISANLALAVVCSEDQNFLSHFGFDFKAIEQSIEHHRNKTSRRLRGGSTISQQTAKNVFLWPHRSWIRKGLEAYFTVLIELFWSKERILEVYLNSIEMGNGIYGAEAAGQAYFDKHAANLDRRQAAAIAAILPSPREYRLQPPSPYIRERIAWIDRQMRLMRALRFD